MWASCVFRIGNWGCFRHPCEKQRFMHAELLNNPHVDKLRGGELSIAGNPSRIAPCVGKAS